MAPTPPRQLQEAKKTMIEAPAPIPYIDEHVLQRKKILHRHQHRSEHYRSVSANADEIQKTV